MWENGREQMGKDEKKDGEMIQVPVKQRERGGQRKAGGGNAALYSAAQRWQATGKHSYRWKGKCLRLTKNIGKSWALRESIHCKLADK